MKSLRAFVVLAASVLTPACNPASCWAPADLPKDKPLELTSTSKTAPAAQVDVVLDELGVPHLYGNDEVDLSYGLGFLHARDRLFQVFVYLHASEGRLTELLGEDLLPIDRQNRLLTWHLDEQEAALSDRDRALVQAYCDGLNDGAAQAGRSAEMALLGVDWEPVAVRDVLAIMRLQQWSQSVGFEEEMTRWRLARSLGVDDARFRALWQDTPDNGHPIVTAETHTGDAFTLGQDRDKTRYHRAPQAQPASSSSSSSSGPVRAPQAQPSSAQPARGFDVVAGALSGLHLDIGARFAHGGTGHSNEWVVDGAHNDSGAPVLCNDPHLDHGAPGVFYMVHMEAPDFTVAGGSFPGIPAVLIGHGRHIAWGVTNAYADTQDVVVLRPWAGHHEMYELDGGPMNFTHHVERFHLGKGDDAKVVDEDYADSVFGPVLPARWGTFGGAESWNTDDERLVLQWTAYNFPERTGEMMSAFWDLAASTTIEAAHVALQKFTAPAMNVAMAIAENDDGPAGIHYRLNGIIPVRGDDQRVDFPRLGVTRDSGFTGVLDAAQKPQLDNPVAGFFVSSNQRVVDNGVLSQRFVGYEGARHYRASRIHERLAAMMKDGKKPSPEELLSIQQDVESIEARTLAPIYGAHCPKNIEHRDADLVTRFCKAVADFDGVYTTEAHATPFARVHQAFKEVLLRRHMSTDLMEQAADQSWVIMAINGLVERAGNKRENDGDRALLDDPRTDKVEGFDDVLALATKEALDIVVDEAGGSDSDWRWAKLHTLQFKGVLARAPWVGGLFQTGEHEESGTGTAPRAEAPSTSNRLRVSSGAGLRNFAVMTSPPVVKLVNDTGQSGHFGHRHLEDQYPLWTKGEPRVLQRTKDDVEATNDGLLRLLPAR
jgi:penicillin amidase